MQKRTGLEKILNNELSDMQWLQVSIAICDGGVERCPPGRNVGGPQRDTLRNDGTDPKQTEDLR